VSDPSFEQFVAERATPLLRTAHLLTGGRSRADDLLQTALIRTRRQWDGVTDLEQATVVARRELVAAHVGWRTRMRVGDLLADSPLLAGTRGLPGFAQPVADVGRRDDLSTALAQLPPRLRVALVLHHGEGLSDADTADALGSRAADVPRLVELGLAQLEARIAAPPTEPGALVERLRRELPVFAGDVTADPDQTTALVAEGAHSQRQHLAGLLALLGFAVLVVLLVVVTV
jgi:DNA-directed RNA polymerase specialized sigma24 family protein